MKTKSIFKISLLVVTLLFIYTIGFAQMGGPSPPPKEKKMEHLEDREERKENMEAQKIAFITKKVDLTPEDAQKFWPVYNQYSDKMQELRKKRRQDFKDAKQKEEQLSDKDVEQAIENDFAIRQNELDLQKQYNEKFKAVLPLKKVAKLYVAEEEFRMGMMDKARNKPPVRQ